MRAKQAFTGRQGGATVYSRLDLEEEDNGLGASLLTSPGAAGGRAPAGTILYSGQTYSPSGPTSVVWLVDVDGSRRAVTPEDRWSGYARWVVEDDD